MSAPVSIAQHESIAELRQGHPALADFWGLSARALGVTLSLPFVESVESSPRTVVRYLSAVDAEGRLLGVLPAYLTSDEANPYYDLAALTGAPADGLYPSLLVGSRSGYRNGLLVDPALSPTDAAEVAGLLLSAAREHAVEAGARTVTAAFVDSASWATLARAEPHAVDTTYFAIVDLALELDRFHGETPALAELDYHRWLGSDRSRKLRKQAARIVAAGSTETEGPLVDELPVAADLLAQHADTLGLRPTDWLDYVSQLARVMGDRARLVLLRDAADEPIACVVLLTDGTSVHTRAYGARPGLRGDEYFEVGYRAPMLAAFRLGARRLHFGPEGCVPKLIRGATPEPLWTTVLPVGRAPVPPPAAAADQRLRTADAWRDRYARSAHRSMGELIERLHELPPIT
ncbi:GNAT family N-acetyltransferase [Jatrophihabitans lederbergiae]|uniref:GNAT family N-acetyltransferase n=1 Tax=Jatrophihabitans lederbergiae TaxID=3075547 RepID=A0ABU2JCJ9_9ACTN|nr:GNAT family N-acetyltransferase [Jatrophihabitans sp. DSM 44399]MDT0262453.1 GNAT family N-acetyltransferase [Jatrophihabitans sp. DSM 44399]